MLIWNHRTSRQWQRFCQRCSINKYWGIAGVLSIWLPLIRTYWGLLDNSLASLKAEGGGGIMYSVGIQQTGPYKPNLISPLWAHSGKDSPFDIASGGGGGGWGHHAATVMICLQPDFIPGETRWLHSATTYEAHAWDSASTFTVQ